MSGAYTGSESASSAGSIVNRSVSGTLSVVSDCSGSATFNDNLDDSVHLSVVSANDGSEIAFIETDSGTNIAGIAVRQLVGPAFGITDTTTRAVGPISPGKLVSVVG